MDGDQDSLGAIDRELMLLIRRVETAGRIGPLDRSGYLLLGELAERGPLKISALAQTFHLDLSTASRQTAALESKGLVKRLPRPADGRANLLCITPLGQERLESTREARRALLADLLAGWSKNDRRQFGAALARFNQAVDRRRRTANGDARESSTAQNG